MLSRQTTPSLLHGGHALQAGKEMNVPGLTHRLGLRLTMNSPAGGIITVMVREATKRPCRGKAQRLPWPVPRSP